MVNRKASIAAKAELLTKVYLFSGCSKKELAEIASVTDEIRVPSGTVLVEEGATGERFYVIAEGLVYATIAGKKVGSIAPGSFFGEMALLDQGPRTATVTAELPTRLLVLTASAFHKVIQSNPSVAVKIMRGLAQRLRAVEAPPAH